MAFLLSFPILFTIIVIALLIAISVLVELENATWASVLVTASLIFVGFTYFEPSWEFIKLNAVDLLKYSGYYIVSGIIWSVIKWKLYISASASKFKKIKEGFIAKHKSIGDNWEKWIRYLNDNFTLPGHRSFSESNEPEDIIKKITVNAGEKKGVIISWIGYWPMSLAATFLNNPFRKFFSWLFDMLSGVYDRMSKSSVKGLDDGMQKF